MNAFCRHITAVAAVGTGWVCLVGSGLTGAGLAEEGAVQLHPLNAYCIEYAVSGQQTGTSIECIRNHGRERAEIRKLTGADGGQAGPIDHQVIHRGDTVIAIDQTSRRAVRVRDPDFATLTRFMSGKDGAEIAEAFGRALGGEPTGESLTFAGLACNEWSTEYGGMEASWCMSADGLLLYFDAARSVTKEAVRVVLGDGGPDAYYDVPEGMSVMESSDPSAINTVLGDGL